MAVNPVQRRLAELLQHWQAFIDLPDKRLLLWQVADGGQRMLDAFFEMQRHEDAKGGATSGASGDTFIVFDAPFEQAIAYSRALKQTLAGQYAASHEALRSAGQTPDWRFAPDEVPDTAAAFMRALASLAGHHAVFGHLVAVLSPAGVSDDEAWAAWVARALEAGVPEGVRLLVPDFDGAPRLERLAGADHPEVLVQALALDAWSIAQETFAQEPAVGPGGVFRNLLTGLFALAEKGSADQVLLKARDALAFAHRQGWPDQEVAVRLLTAGVMLKERRCDDAVNHYRHARTSAETARAAGHPAGGQLVLQSWFGEAAAWLAAGEPKAAAPCYRAAEQLAAELPNPLMRIEALRMGTFCLARAGDTEAALAFGQPALDVGDKLRPASRPMTTLPLHCFEMLRLIEPERAARIEAIRHELERDQAREHGRLDGQAAALESSADAAALRRIEQQHLEAGQVLLQQAQERADREAAGAGAAFVGLFERARDLFGPTWPIAMQGAVGPAPAKTRGVAA
ncbi:hypothetical protein ACQ86G_26435 [Roseateles chitinivorans]|uniref:hypothetical protein n=1 Tax=Roseateles chitinivorans TaxID=2917965 RepID=UPI003D66FF90